MRGSFRSAAAGMLLALVAAASAGADAVLTVRPTGAAGPAAASALRTQAERATRMRAEGWRSVPHVLGEPGADWSPQAARRAGWRPTPSTASTFARALAGSGVSVGPPDTFNIAFLRLEFENDRDGGASTGNGRFNLDPADTIANPVDRPPHHRTFFRKHLEALSRYYDAQSYGRVVVRGTVWPSEETGAYRVSDMADFGPWRFNRDIEGAAVSMFQTMMNAAHAQARARNDSIPWETFDRVVIVHAGGDLQSDLRGDSKHDIPSFTLTVVDSSHMWFPDSNRARRPVDRMMIIPETQNQDGFFGALNGVIAHEAGHLLFGYADLYNFNTGFPVVGLWSLMDSGNLAGAIVRQASGEEIFVTGLLPPSVDPFHRAFTTDALQFAEVTYGVEDSLRDSQRNPDMRVITLSSDEILVLENRYQSIAPTDSVRLDQDDTTRVVLGPKSPDRYEYDALLPGGGVLVWHIDTSVIPFSNSLRPNPDFGINTNHLRLGVEVIEADGLDDLGDPGSPFILGSYRDPYYVGNNTLLSDHTLPNLIPHIGTRPHVRFEVLDTLKSAMRFRADREWQLSGWPVFAEGRFPPEGPQLLAIDADGDSKLEVCWAGGDSASADSNGVFAYRVTGAPLGSGLITSLPRRPIAVMAALPTTGPRPEHGPSLFAVTTALAGVPQPGDGTGELWLLDHQGFTPPGSWPVIPAGGRASTAPIIAGRYPDAAVIVGATDGHLYAFNLDGSLRARTDLPLGGPVTGRLAVWASTTLPFMLAGEEGFVISAGSRAGDIAMFLLNQPRPPGPITPGMGFFRLAGWPQQLSSRPGFTPDFLWLDLDGRGGAAGDPSGCSPGQPELVAHDADRLWAYCLEGGLLRGWGRSLGDTIAAGLGAGDPDGDGLPEVLVQTHNSKIAFINLSGAPSPGWPRPGSPEGALVDDTLLTERDMSQRYPSLSPPLAIDLEGSGRPAVVALNVSGIIAALTADGRTPAGWPLATGSGVSGAPLAADLDGDGKLELIAPDRSAYLYGYALPADTSLGSVSSWTMLGGDAQRTSSLPSSRTSLASAPRRGPLIAGTLKAFPNPARRQAVSIAYTLTEPARVEVRVLDTAGQEVASFQRDGRIAENLEVWNPGAAPAGLYLVHVKIRGATTTTSGVLPVGVLK
ncbi:MAG: T9SS type A sorting domain-containing protein [Candidatus Eisenbacteria bacterium]